ncbi:MAG: ATP-grasp domain-containing protein [Acidimicrobiia bacterium]
MAGLGCDVVAVASVKRWLAEDFVGAVETFGVPVVWTVGFSYPDLAEYVNPVWWAPTEYAARLLHAGVAFETVSPGPLFMSGLDETMTGRVVHSLRFKQFKKLVAAGELASGFVKLSEVKTDLCPAGWYPDLGEFVGFGETAKIPDDTMLELSTTRLQLVNEYRVFVANQNVLQVVPYRLGDLWWEPGLIDVCDPLGEAAKRFAGEVVSGLGTNQPAGWVLDIGVTHSGQWVVVEGNPVWSSGLYDTNPRNALVAIDAAFNAGPGGLWRWEPDPWLVTQAQKKVVLTASNPITM